MIKEVKYRGVTTTPSDYESPDGDLATSSNVVVDGDKLVVTKEPVQSYPASGLLTRKPLFIHNTTGNNTFYILLGNNNDLWYRDSEGSEIEIADAPNQEPKKIDAIGNTLIVMYDDGSIHYIIYKDGRYEYKGTHIPTVELQFGLWGEGDSLFHIEADTDGYTFNHKDESHYEFTIPEGQIDTLTNLLFGQAERLIDEKYYGEGKFIFPFFIRFALRLYDGSYTNMSAPMLLLTNCGKSPTFGFYTTTSPRPSGGYDTVSMNRLHVVSMPSILKVLWRDDEKSVLNGWDDIVSGLDVFISAPIMTYDVLEKIGNTLHASANAALPGVTDAYCESYVEEYVANAYARTSYRDFYGNEINLITFEAPYLEMDGLEKKVSEVSTFYKLFGYKFNSNDDYYGYDVVMDGASSVSDFVNVPFDKKVLPVLETQKALPDDYYSNDTIRANSEFVYNSRVTFGNISRFPYKGFRPSSFLPPYSFDGSGQVVTPVTQETRILTYHVVIIENGIRSVVGSDYSNVNGIIMSTNVEQGIVPSYFFYPNPNAKQLIICKQNGASGPKEYYTYDLTPHPMLNGAFAVFIDDFTVGSGGDRPDVLNTPTNPIPYPSQIYTSETYNPYVFKAENVNQLPMSADIINIASTTQPMSQGQFGQFPLYVFSDAGIFALQLASNGSFSTLTPVTRDVILGDGSSLTQLDDSILFATKQGIMELVGKKTRCLTDKLDKKLSIPNLGNDLYAIIGTGTIPVVPDIKAFVNGCQMVYDYIHARVIVFNNSSSYVYVYSAKDDSWTLMPVAGLIDTINSFPDPLAVAEKEVSGTTKYVLIDLSTITDEAGSGGTASSGWFITRPIDLDAPNDFKLIDVVRQNGVFEEYLIKNEQELYEGKSAMNDGHTVIEQILYGSNDLINWFVIGSSDSRLINGRTSAGFKWFRLAVKSTLKPGESISSVTFSYRIKAENPHLF